MRGRNSPYLGQKQWSLDLPYSTAGYWNILTRKYRVVKVNLQEDLRTCWEIGNAVSRQYERTEEQEAAAQTCTWHCACLGDETCWLLERSNEPIKAKELNNEQGMIHGEIFREEGNVAIIF